VERDAHAWVEVFFPTYGWIQFEPTASQSLVQRPVAVEPTIVPTPPADEENLKDLRNARMPETSQLPMATQPELIRWVQFHRIVLAALLALLVLIVVVALLARRRRRTFLESPELLASLLGMVGTWAGRFRIPWPASDTPLEHAARFGHRIPDASAVVSRIAGLFAAHRYGRQRPSSESVQSVASEWQRLQPNLWKQWLPRILRSRTTSLPTPQAPAEQDRQLLDPDRGQ